MLTWKEALGYAVVLQQAPLFAAVSFSAISMLRFGVVREAVFFGAVCAALSSLVFAVAVPEIGGWKLLVTYLLMSAALIAVLYYGGSLLPQSEIKFPLLPD